MNKCVNECVKSRRIPFWTPQVPGTARPLSSPPERQILRLWADTHLLGRALRVVASPVPPWPPTRLPGHRSSLLTHLCFSSAWISVGVELRGLGLERVDPGPGQPQPMGTAGWGLRASPAPEVRGLGALSCRAGCGCGPGVVVWQVGAPTATRDHCGSQAVQKHRHTLQGKGVSRSVEATEPTPWEFSGVKVCAEAPSGFSGSGCLLPLDSERPALCVCGFVGKLWPLGFCSDYHAKVYSQGLTIDLAVLC